MFKVDEIKKLELIKCFNSPTIKRIMKEMNFSSFDDFLTYLPRKYADYQQTELTPFINNQPVTFYGVIRKADRPKKIRNNLTIFSFQLFTQNEVVQCVVYNQWYLSKSLVGGRKVVVNGKYDYFKNKLEVNKVIYYHLDELQKIMPIYTLPPTFRSLTYTRLVRRVLDFYVNEDLISDILPLKYRSRYQLGTKIEALEKCHFPKTHEDYKDAFRYLKYEEFLVYSLGMKLRKIENNLAVGKIRKVNRLRVDEFMASLPYQLTNDQKVAVDEIILDFTSPKKMYRMLQGDVGSGKTVVALAVALAAITAKVQVAYMVPSDLLARQVFQVASNYFAKQGIRIALLVSAMNKKEKVLLKEQIAAHEIDLIIGTHAIIQEDVSFSELGLVIIDEQHRFGVEQRGEMINKGKYVDTLFMSATPIPRTLAMILYGEMDLSTLTVFPYQKRDITTRFINSSNAETAYEIISQKLATNQQIFVVCPLIEESEVMDLANVTEIFEKISTLVSKEYGEKKKVEFLHSKINAEERIAILTRFRDKVTDIIITTVVIEVGIDIKDISNIIILDSERFGLSQIHQLRGRIGRNGQPGYCYLLTNSRGAGVQRRLKFLVDNDDGFEVAKFDLLNRGPGDFLGNRQSGSDSFQVGDVGERDDFKILTVAQKDSQEIINENEPDSQEFIEYVKTIIKSKIN